MFLEQLQFYTYVVCWGFLTDWWGLTGPVMQVATAAGDTMEAESMTVDFSLKRSEDDLLTGTVTMEIDHDARDLALLLKITGGDTDVAVGIYDEQLLYEVDGEVGGAVYIGAELDDFFDDMEEGDSASLDEIVESIVDLLLKDDKIRRTVNKDALEDAILSVLYSLNTRSWAKENAGFSEGTRGDMEVLTFQPKFGDLADAVGTELKPAFKDAADYKDFKKWIADNREDLNNTVDLTLEFGIEDDYLTHISLEIAKEEESLSLILDVDQINKTKVDTKALEAMLDRA